MFSYFKACTKIYLHVINFHQNNFDILYTYENISDCEKSKSTVYYIAIFSATVCYNTSI